MKAIGSILSIVLMVTLAPFTTVTALVLYDPNRWGGPPTLGSLIVMSIFAVITIPMWITYIPAIVITPILMNAIARHKAFVRLPIIGLALLALPLGALAGIVILSPGWMRTLSDTVDLTINWMFAGAASGAITFTMITIIYKTLIIKGIGSSNQRFEGTAHPRTGSPSPQP